MITAIRPHRSAAAVAGNRTRVLELNSATPQPLSYTTVWSRSLSRAHSFLFAALTERRPSGPKNKSTQATFTKQPLRRKSFHKLKKKKTQNVFIWSGASILRARLTCCLYGEIIRADVQTFGLGTCTRHIIIIFFIVFDKTCRNMNIDLSRTINL